MNDVQKRAMNYLGTVSSDTLKNSDLIPKFFDVLSDIDQEKAQNIRTEYRWLFNKADKIGWSNAVDPTVETKGHEEDDIWLVDALIDALDDCSPTGFYFGTSEGDGALFGFFELGDSP